MTTAQADRPEDSGPEGSGDEPDEAPETPTDEPKPVPVQDPPAEPNPTPYVVRTVDRRAGRIHTGQQSEN